MGIYIYRSVVWRKGVRRITLISMHDRFNDAISNSYHDYIASNVKMISKQRISNKLGGKQLWPDIMPLPARNKENHYEKPGLRDTTWNQDFRILMSANHSGAAFGDNNMMYFGGIYLESCTKVGFGVCCFCYRTAWTNLTAMFCFVTYLYI